MEPGQISSEGKHDQTNVSKDHCCSYREYRRGLGEGSRGEVREEQGTGKLGSCLIYLSLNVLICQMGMKSVPEDML